MADGPRFAVDRRTLTVDAPVDWTDEQADAALRQVGRVLDQTEAYLRARLRYLHPDLAVTRHEEDD